VDEAIEGLRAEIGELRDLFQRRLLNDRLQKQQFDELHKRLELADDGHVQQALGSLLRQVVLVLDRIPESTQDGLAASIRVELLELLARQGAYPYGVLGEPFDPRLHQAVGTAVVEDAAQDGLVLREVRTGYVLGEKILRAAEVEVGRLAR
jgi:molecular chaperone GrpE